jgi:hypothetical protein
LLIKKILLISIIVIFVSIRTFSQSKWLEQESENFKVIYRESHAHLVPKIFGYAETAFADLQKLFNYKTSEKIIINTFDAYDYGYGAATSVPQNYIRLEIEPMEPGYESVPYNDRFQWIISHELVHIVVNDNSSEAESLMRKFFSKVAPDQVQPLTIIYSYLTNFNRYTPRWHQESMAVFLETWMNGGYGRTLGSFDEMYFRSLVLEDNIFPTEIELDVKHQNNSFLLENIFYIYGARFVSYLTLKYGYEKLIKWFTTDPSEFYKKFTQKFIDIYNFELNDAWNDFILFERDFQKSNFEKLTVHTPTTIELLSNENFGWVTQPYLDRTGNNVFFAYHRSHQLAEIQEFNLNNKTSLKISSLPTPSMLQVASTAYDYNLGLFFYTTNNNQLYRDLWVLNTDTKENKMLFKDCRIGSLTISSKTHELLGIEHSNGFASLVSSAYPFEKIERIFRFEIDNEIHQLAVSPSGNKLAAVLHQSSGEQKIVLMNLDSVKSARTIVYEDLYNSGSPENISWSSDENFIFWNAYTSGVSNIYRLNMQTRQVEVISHALRGFFRPLPIGQNSIFAFELTTQGFVPIVIDNNPTPYVPAINYLGQLMLDKYPDLMKLHLPSVRDSSFKLQLPEKEYSGLSNLLIQTFIPVISGFQSQKVLGFFGRIADPLLDHDLFFEVGYSPFGENSIGPKFHAKLKYDYKKQIEIGIEHNAADFYDLFNKRKRGMTGTKFSLGNTHYWVYDNPLKIKQQTEISVYSGITFLNDNTIQVSQPDFFVAKSILDIKNLRRSIGSTDFEQGNNFTTTFMFFGAQPKTPKLSFQIWSEFGERITWIAPHNILLLSIAAGYLKPNNALVQSGFFIGSFRNREVENVDAKQYRNVFSFPGIPIYSLAANNFLKLSSENNFPPIRISNISFGRHYLSHLDFSLFSQGMIVKSDIGKYWGNTGGQLNFIFKHWDNLESTFSAGIAKAWFNKGNDWEWFLSLKLLKN